MGLLFDRVWERSVSTGVGNFTLTGCPFVGYFTFAAGVGIGVQCYYGIENPLIGELEIGIGTLIDATTLRRDEVIRSTNSNALVAFSSGTKDVFCTQPAESADKTYQHTQSSSSATWTVNHNLRKRPAVTIVDSAGTQVYGNVSYTNDNSLVLSFSAPFSGTAYCN